MTAHEAFRDGWHLDWSGDPKRQRAWHVSGAYASIRGRDLLGLPIVRVDRQMVVDRRIWSIDALRAEAYMLQTVGFNDQHPSLVSSVVGDEPAPLPDAGSHANRRKRCYWLTDIEASRVETLLQWLRDCPA
ncbi:MAG: hypothetical protein Q4D91_05785 [Lautropia sp.]|nr:hypothetical protein [Lautropia sp.]